MPGPEDARSISRGPTTDREHSTCSRLNRSPPDKEIFEDVLFVVGGGELFLASRTVDEVIGEARLRFHVHDLVARPTPGADEIDLMAVGHAPSRRWRIDLDYDAAASSREAPPYSAQQRNRRAATPIWGLSATVRAA